MQSLWNDIEASHCKDDLDLRVYSSQLLGRNPDLVLHGGGNTSVKITETNILGEPEEILFVKGSGWDLATIERAGFSPVRLSHLLKLAKLENLSDPQMVNELKTHMTLASAPAPSVEAILHAILPYKYVDHTHADAVVTVTNTPDGLTRVQEIYGDRVVVIPYVMPGFDLARVCAEEFAKQCNDETIGMVLMNHGMFSFGQSAKQSYERMIQLVAMAEQYIKDQRAWSEPDLSQVSMESDLTALADLRLRLSRVINKPIILHSTQNRAVLDFLDSNGFEQSSQQGPATPDHVIRTKRLPMLGDQLDDYIKAYEAYFAEFSPRSKQGVVMLDPLPRVILDKRFGMCSLGRSVKDAHIVRDIYQHTIKIIHDAEQLESYQALPAADIFDMEYWDLEQAKLRKTGNIPVFQGEVVLITGAAAGIGKACVEAFLNKGAAVIALDIRGEVQALFDSPAYCGIECDVTDAAALDSAIHSGVLEFGGIDMAVLNAGIFPASMTISEMDMTSWDKTLSINLNANVMLLKKLHPFLTRAPKYGRIVLMGSKNVPAPGPGASAYSVSKAALTQLMRVTALEWGAEGVRINALHPNAVFDTDIWTDDILAARASSYGLTIEEYKKRNVMGVEIRSKDVAELATELCSPSFSRTTAAQIPIDGGDLRVI